MFQSNDIVLNFLTNEMSISLNMLSYHDETDSLQWQ